MNALRHHRILVALLVLTALAAHVFAMGQMRAWLPASDAAAAIAMEVCHGSPPAATSAAGGDVVADASPGHGHGSGGKSAKGDCPLCSHSVAAAPSPAAAVGRLAVPGRPLLPALFLDAPDPLFAWAAQQSRGPPSIV
jgi:hypothetical protein